jgi:hypothetical protein
MPALRASQTKGKKKKKERRKWLNSEVTFFVCHSHYGIKK